jgi:hypothetical protein
VIAIEITIADMLYLHSVATIDAAVPIVGTSPYMCRYRICCTYTAVPPCSTLLYAH